jgi:asparagine synthetase B (glutamine-hydrolysing)
MCGLFGFNGTCPEAFEAIALQAAGRGPHAHGWTAVYPDGPVTERYLGPLRDNLSQFRRALDREPRALIGHARLSTIGGDSYCRIEDAQPVNAGRFSVVHNGNADFGDRNPATASGNDSERVALLMAHYLDDDSACTPTGALRLTLDMLPARAPYAVLALYRNESVMASRRSLPLYRQERDGTTILSSTEFLGSCSIAERGIVELKIPYATSWGQCAF